MKSERVLEKEKKMVDQKNWKECLLYPAPKVGTMEIVAKEALLVWSSRIKKRLDR